MAARPYFEFFEQQLVAAIVRQGDTVVDVGANIGLYVVAAGIRGADVRAYEPDDRARYVLQSNVLLNGLENRVSVSPCAVGSTSGTVHFTTGLEMKNKVTAASSQVSVRPVPMVHLDGELSALPGRVRVLKVDAEGHDEEVVAGAWELIARDRPIVFVEVWDGAAALRDAFRMTDYLCLRMAPATAVLTEVPSEFSGQANLCFAPRECFEQLSSAFRTLEVDNRVHLRVRVARMRT